MAPVQSRTFAPPNARCARAPTDCVHPPSRVRNNGQHMTPPVLFPTPFDRHYMYSAANQARRSEAPSLELPKCMPCSCARSFQTGTSASRRRKGQSDQSEGRLAPAPLHACGARDRDWRHDACGGVFVPSCRLLPRMLRSHACGMRVRCGSVVSCVCSRSAPRHVARC